MLVLEDDEASRRPAPIFADLALADYEGGYADVKIVARSFIAEVAERGSEPARWAFEDAFAVWSCDDGIAAALEAACAYPESGRDERLRDFVGHAVIAKWYLGEAERRAEPYLTQYASSSVVLYTGRVVLAHNRMLFPFHKWFLRQVERAPERPPGFMDDVHAMLQAPTLETAGRLVASVQELTGVRPTVGESAASFMRRTEWAWRTGSAPFAEI